LLQRVHHRDHGEHRGGDGGLTIRCRSAPCARRHLAPVEAQSHRAQGALLQVVMPARQSRKLSNCSGSSTSALRSTAIAACRSSRFLPVTRSLSPLICASTLSLASFSVATSFFATGCSMPCFTVIFCRAPARLVSTS